MMQNIGHETFSCTVCAMLQVKVTNFKKSNFEILQETSHTTPLLKLLDKMYKYEMDPTRTVDATELTQDAGRTEGWTDGWTE